MSFENFTASSYVTGSAPFTGLANLKFVFTDPIFISAVEHTLIFVPTAIFGQIVIGFFLAQFFNRHFPLNSLLRSLLLLPWLLPIIVSTTIARWMLDEDSGVVNEVLRALRLTGSAGVPWLTSGAAALVSVIGVQIWIGIPFSMVILYSGIQTIPQELYESSSLDGAGAFQKLRYITLPTLRPVIAVVLTLSLIYTLRSFDVVWILTGGGPADATQTLATLSYQTAFTEFQFGQGAAIGDLLLALSLLTAVVYVRSYRRSIAEA
jgi:multiple sugar transport system permease protein